MPCELRRPALLVGMRLLDQLGRPQQLGFQFQLEWSKVGDPRVLLQLLAPMRVRAQVLSQLAVVFFDLRDEYSKSSTRQSGIDEQSA
jgi:hypothetical protein